MNYTLNVTDFYSLDNQEYVTLNNCLDYTQHLRDESIKWIILSLILIIIIFILLFRRR